jgi:hypothetical protein
VCTDKEITTNKQLKNNLSYMISYFLIARARLLPNEMSEIKARAGIEMDECSAGGKNYC